jgi:hypothetical protein
LLVVRSPAVFDDGRPRAPTRTKLNSDVRPDFCS